MRTGALTSYVVPIEEGPHRKQYGVERDAYITQVVTSEQDILDGIALSIA